MPAVQHGPRNTRSIRHGAVLSVGRVSLSYVGSSDGGGPVECLRADLDELVTTDVVALPDATLRSGLLELMAARNQLDAATASWLAVFDARGLYDDDACKTAAVWVRAYGRGSAHAAAGLV